MTTIPSPISVITVTSFCLSDNIHLVPFQWSQPQVSVSVIQSQVCVPVITFTSLCQWSQPPVCVSVTTFTSLRLGDTVTSLCLSDNIHHFLAQWTQLPSQWSDSLTQWPQSSVAITVNGRWPVNSFCLGHQIHRFVSQWSHSKVCIYVITLNSFYLSNHTQQSIQVTALNRLYLSNHTQHSTSVTTLNGLYLSNHTQQIISQ